MAKKEKNNRGSKTISLKIEVWKKLSNKKTNEDYDNFSDLVEDLLKGK